MKDQANRRTRKPWTVSRRARKLFHYSRLAHIYLSAVFLGLLVFFCVTGILLNHTEWLQGKAEEGVIERPLLPAVLDAWKDHSWDDGTDLPEMRLLLEHLAAEYGLRGPKEVRTDNELREVTFDYQMASSYVFVIVNAEQQSMRFEYRKFGLWQILGDLHKGRNSGRSWSWLIDISAAAMILFSLTGLFILLQNLKHRRVGLILTACGLTLPVLVYFLLVPRFLGA